MLTGPESRPWVVGGGTCAGRLSPGVDPGVMVWVIVGQGPVFTSESLAFGFWPL